MAQLRRFVSRLYDRIWGIDSSRDLHRGGHIAEGTLRIPLVDTTSKPFQFRTSYTSLTVQLLHQLGRVFQLQIDVRNVHELGVIFIFSDIHFLRGACWSNLFTTTMSDNDNFATSNRTV